MRGPLISLVTAFACGVALLFLGGCSTSGGVRSSPAPVYRDRSGPPPHAPAHGYRKKHAYRYYPSSHVYYDTGRRLYFYLESGAWRAGVSLHGSIRVNVGEAVTIEMASDTPYVEFHTHKVKYPPRHAGKGKGKGKGKKKGRKR